MYALITGASSGIGKAMAEQLAKRKINLILNSRRQPELDRIKTDLQSRYQVAVEVIAADLSVASECHRLYRECLPFAPEIVVNNAGFGLIGLFADLALEDELRMIRLNIDGLHILTKLFVGSMNQGVILNVASMAGFIPSPRLAAYAATKAYVFSFSRAVDYELRKGKKAIRVLSLCPGPVDTNFSAAAGGTIGLKGLSADRCAAIAVRGLMRRRPTIIPGWGMKLLRFFLRFVPLGLVLPISFSIQKKKS
ncbi:MAG TPA: SDR family oxidoreductase [Bacillota bacterium]|nr:SDR family oxidoreductase [Bacillota bacterium]